MYILKMIPYIHNSEGYGNASFIERDMRMQELVSSVKNTTNYLLVEKLFIFYHDKNLVHYISTQNFDQKGKITYVKNKYDTLSGLFRYANNHLRNKLVMVMNADTYPVEGFDQVNYEVLSNNRTAYFLSRYDTIVHFPYLLKRCSDDLLKLISSGIIIFVSSFLFSYFYKSPLTQN